ncbi:LysR substrate-binding domain-containing protein [Amycolatopsis sp. H20-H5]|uniref:LysR substrate-binding domain-containing protein n=1 Tax=Amycolatopsis sp. H20-H5 TaxID=3046309 RepID=UPI002DB7900C|nr:LysR substrate-binding domain-containing protein [Amycolatopsis sp. H20-H5]MEC3982515.1 LysR substrate-binding domain-containing protein [Amycolatopsis sp. H20-H5]
MTALDAVMVAFRGSRIDGVSRRPGGATLVGAVVRTAWGADAAETGLVAAGPGVTLVPGIAATAVRADVALVRILGEHPAPRVVALATRARAGAVPHVQVFAELLREVAADLMVELGQRVRGR